MKPNSVKFESLVSNEVSGWHKDAEERRKQRGWRDKAFHIALILLDYKDTHDLNQAQLAGKIGVSNQYINRVLQGKENLDSRSITRIENALGISLIR
ncbi:MAG TPA: helix-turn-helix transcriptional regulator [Marinilabiliaceae bacterium]|nr:helix-turn-helix transcriptional regulator [Marinilabiliaceae bacterium]